MNKIFIYRKSNEGKLDDSKKLDTFLPPNDHLDNASKLLKKYFLDLPDFIILKALENIYKASYNPITIKCHKCSQYEEEIPVSKLFENEKFPDIYSKGSIVGFFPCRTVYETSKYNLNVITATMQYVNEFVDNTTLIAGKDYFDIINEFTTNKVLAIDPYSIEHIENYEFMAIPLFSYFKEPGNTNFVKIYYDKDNYPKFAMIGDPIVSFLNYLSVYYHWVKNLEDEMLNKLDVTQKLGLLYVDNLNSELNQEDNEMNEGVLIQSAFLRGRAKLSNSKMELEFLEIPKILDMDQITKIENTKDDKIKCFSNTIDDNEPFTFNLPIIAKSKILNPSELGVIHVIEKDGTVKLMYATENGLSVDDLKILDTCTICLSSCNHIKPNDTGADLKSDKCLFGFGYIDGNDIFYLSDQNLFVNCDNKNTIGSEIPTKDAVYHFSMPIYYRSFPCSIDDLYIVHGIKEDGSIQLIGAFEQLTDINNVKIPKNINKKYISKCGEIMTDINSPNYNKNDKEDMKLTKLESKRWLIGLVNDILGCIEFKESSFDIIADNSPINKETAIKRFIKRHFDEKCFDDVCIPSDLEVKSSFEINDERGLCLFIPQRTFIDNLLNKDTTKSPFNVVAIPIYNTDEGDFIESKDKDFLIAKSDYEFYAFETRGMKDKINIVTDDDTSRYINPRYLIDISVSNQILNEIFKTAPVNIDFENLQYIKAFNYSELVFDNTKGGEYVTWDLILACLSNQIV